MISPRWLVLFSTLLCLITPALATKADPNPAESRGCPAPALSRLQRHTIAEGETIESIAQQYNLIPATLMGMNPMLRTGKAPVGAEILIPPYNGIEVQVPVGQTWKDVAATYKVRLDLLFEINGCQEAPQIVFVPGVNWSPLNPSEGGKPSTGDLESGAIAGYPLPAPATVILAYGLRSIPNKHEVAFHSGIDLAAPVGTPVLAVGEGTVAFAGDRGTYGNLIVINHQHGKQTRYAHLATVSVTVGQRLSQGEQLGTVGSTGTPDIAEPHLHFEIRSNSQLGWVAEDPTPYLASSQATNPLRGNR